ncbi:MAG: DUF4834 family protein [Prevotellaceae bacterium]|nr:DUF4834 family protein [Prevotellaceae bacterium]
MHVLGCLVILVFGAFFVLTALVGAAGEALRRLLFGRPPGKTRQPGAKPRNEQPRSGKPAGSRGKIFGKGDGEYVDFEELS